MAAAAVSTPHIECAAEHAANACTVYGALVYKNRKFPGVSRRREKMSLEDAGLVLQFG